MLLAARAGLAIGFAGAFFVLWDAPLEEAGRRRDEGRRVDLVGMGGLDWFE